MNCSFAFVLSYIITVECSKILVGITGKIPKKPCFSFTSGTPRVARKDFTVCVVTDRVKSGRGLFVGEVVIG